MPLGLGRRPDTQGQCNHSTPRKTTLRRRVPAAWVWAPNRATVP